MRDTLLANTQRFARGLPANNALFWGARGMGKSSLVKAVHGEVGGLKLVEIHRDDIASLPRLLGHLRAAPGHHFILFCDDLSFEALDTSYKSLKAVLEGGIEGRPANVLFYATSNRRHLMPREMVENERSTAINPSEGVEEKVSLSDRFGLWIGFHNCSQDDYLDMVRGYAEHYGLQVAPETLDQDALEWTRAAAAGRAASPGSSYRISRVGWESRFSLWSFRASLNQLPAFAGGLTAAFDATIGTGGSARHELGRIDRARALAQLEMHLRLTYGAGRPSLGDDLAAPHLVATFDQDLLVMSVSRHPVIGVADQDEIAVSLELVPGIGDDAVLRRHDRGALRHGEIDAVIVVASGLAPNSEMTRPFTGQRKLLPDIGSGSATGRCSQRACRPRPVTSGGDAASAFAGLDLIRLALDLWRASACASSSSARELPCGEALGW